MKIKLHKPTIYRAEGVRLMPGDNEVPDVRTKKFFDNKIVQADIKAGLIEVVKGKPGRPPKAEKEPEPEPEQPKDNEAE